jgi:hypothetical protein
MLDIILSMVLMIYVIGWLYTAIIFWRYGVEHGSRSKLAPIPASVLLALFWPIIFSLTMFSRNENGPNQG